MGATKSEEFSLRDNRIASYCKALGHPARVAIMRYLATRQSCVCGDLVNELPLSQSTVSQHLKALKEAGLITGEVEGTSVCYCINAQAWQQMRQMINGFTGGIANKCC